MGIAVRFANPSACRHMRLEGSQVRLTQFAAGHDRSSGIRRGACRHRRMQAHWGNSESGGVPTLCFLLFWGE